MDLCIILHCILFCQAILLLAPLIYNYQELTSAPTAHLFSFSPASLSPLFLWVAFLCGAYLRDDVSTRRHEAGRAEVACNGALRPEGTARRRWAASRCESPWCGGLFRRIP